jgi:Flp pilus assembly protein TadB
VVFGLRRGFAVGRVEIARLGGGSRLTWELEESRLEIHRAAVAVLSFAAVPLVATLAWPLHPPLLALAPFAAVMGLLAWWLVVSRLRNSGPEDFLAAVVPVEPQTETAAGG